MPKRTSDPENPDWNRDDFKNALTIEQVPADLAAPFDTAGSRRHRRR